MYNVVPGRDTKKQWSRHISLQLANSRDPLKRIDDCWSVGCYALFLHASIFETSLNFAFCRFWKPKSILKTLDIWSNVKKMLGWKQISTTDFPPWNQIESPYHNISNCPRGWMNKWQQQNQCQSRNDPTKCNFWNQLGDPILKRKLIWIREHLLDEVCQMSDFAFLKFMLTFRVITKDVEDIFR